MDWDKEEQLETFKKMNLIYQEHIEILEEENKQLQAQIDFLKEQLDYKTFGKPLYEEEEE